MSSFRVTYSLSTDPNATSTSAFQSRTDVSNLTVVVEAKDINQAKLIVENMFGGPIRCRASNAQQI